MIRLEGKTKLLALRQGQEQNAIETINRAMRPDEVMSMAEDFPLLVGPNSLSDRWVVADGDEVLAHAACRDTRFFSATGDQIRLANIGAVATREDSRRRGYARKLIEKLLANAKGRGAAAAVLWTDQTEFYEKLGFQWAGRERRFLIKRGQVESRIENDFTIAEVLESDLPSMSALRNLDALRVVRSPEEAAALYAIPGSQTLVARKHGQVYAWITVGKGLDFQGAVSEWGGALRLIPSLLAAHMERYRHQQLLVLGPTFDRGFTALASSCGVSEIAPMVMIKLLNEDRLRQDYSALVQSHAPDCDLLETLFGSPEHGEGALPFYIWGLDSQ